MEAFGCGLNELAELRIRESGGFYRHDDGSKDFFRFDGHYFAGRNFDKATVVKMLNDSFDSTAKILSKATPEQLHKTYKTPDGEMTGFEVILFSMDHTTHHRGQCEVYLRVKNIKPTRLVNGDAPCADHGAAAQ